MESWGICGQLRFDCCSRISKGGSSQRNQKKRIKRFELPREKNPEAKIFGLTTGLAVMKINSDLGYEPVTYSELTQDEDFWKGCKSCVNYDILTSKERKNCMCTAMLFDPAEKQKEYEDKMKKITHKATLLERIENAIKKRIGQD